MVDSTAGRIAGIRETIAEALSKSGRASGSVKLMGVSKFHSAEAMVEAAPYLDLLGENRVQEAFAKRRSWPHSLSTPWHLIGRLQRNKARRALETFDAIESVDRLDLAHTLDRILEERGESSYPVLIQVNTSDEDTKGGVAPEEAERLLSAVLEKCPRLSVGGFMTIGPNTGDESEIRRAFTGLRELRDRLSCKFGLPLAELSMGMSGDFKIAIEEGSTTVRIGTSIFGARPSYPV